ncbi:gamma-glutamylcyclotransferase family protein [Streptomyces sp. NPDC005925]|uniref:gamma-glutamylcyclotransferase family protein n=1 Tax=Streptomyces sp. NPDC005925 TaxID=3157172 RepID=UPI00340D5EFC
MTVAHGHAPGRRRRDPERLPFFVYGTLRPGEVNHDAFLRGRTRAEEPARLTGAVLYAGPGYPYAVEEPGGTVHGDLVTAHPEAYDELLLTLDRLEEYIPGDPRSLYVRVAREVTRLMAGDVTRTAGRGGVRARDTVRAWVYVAAPAVTARLRSHGKPIEGGDWRTRPTA